MTHRIDFRSWTIVAIALCVGPVTFAEKPDKWVSYVESTGT